VPAPARDGPVLIDDGAPVRSYKGTKRPPYLLPKIWQTSGPRRLQMAVDKAISEGLDWYNIGNHGAANAFAAMAIEDADWLQFTIDHGLTPDGDLFHDLSSIDLAQVYSFEIAMAAPCSCEVVGSTLVLACDQAAASERGGISCSDAQAGFEFRA
jgi:hypothetical protein